MKNLKKLSIYFAVIFSIVLVCDFTGLVIREAKKDTFYELAATETLVYRLPLGLTAFASLLPYSLSVVTFLSFWAMNCEKWIVFSRMLAIGLIFVLPLSVMTYCYDWFIPPQTQVVSVGKIVEYKEMENVYHNSQSVPYQNIRCNE